MSIRKFHISPAFHLRLYFKIRFRVKWRKGFTAKIVCGSCVRLQNSLKKRKPVNPRNPKNYFKNLSKNLVLSHPENLSSWQTVNLKNLSRTDTVSSCGYNWLQRRKLHAGADCGRFPVKPKCSLSGKMPTENHRYRTCRVADVITCNLFILKAIALLILT